jgi:hypothetical protein
VSCWPTPSRRQELFRTETALDGMLLVQHSGGIAMGRR